MPQCLGQREGVQMRVGRAVGVRLDPADGLVRPRPRAEALALATVPGRRHVGSFSDPGATRSIRPVTPRTPARARR